VHSVAVRTLLEGSSALNINVVSLVLLKLSKFSVKGGQVEGSDLLVELLGEHVHLTVLVLVGVSILPKLDLGENLVGERAGHNERGVTSGATQVQETALSKEDDTVTIGELVAINLVLDVLAFDTGVIVEALSVNFVIEMTNVANNSVVLHLGHVVDHDDVLVAGSGNENISSVDDALNALDFVAFHAGLESADGIALSDDNAAALGLHGRGAALADITETADNNLLASEHNVSSAHETIGEGVLAAVNVIELLLGDRVVDIDGLEEELALVGHLLKSVNTGGGLLRQANEFLGHLGPHVSGTFLELLAEQ